VLGVTRQTQQALTRSRQLSEGLVRLTFAGWNEVDIVPRQVDGLRQLA
jgi:hypothetical protein